MAKLEPAAVSINYFFSASFEFNSPYYFLKIVFESTKDSGSLNDCLISVDGTDMRIPQQCLAIPEDPFSLFKFKGKCALLYKIGVEIFLLEMSCGLTDPVLLESIPTSNFFAVAWLIFWTNMEGWKQTMDIFGNAPPTKNQEMQNRVQSSHKSLNGRLKNWEIFKSMCHHDIMKHENVFWVIAVITQISINAGKQLFDVDYRDL